MKVTLTEEGRCFCIELTPETVSETVLQGNALYVLRSLTAETSRSAILIDLNPEYIELARARIRSTTPGLPLQ